MAEQNIPNGARVKLNADGGPEMVVVGFDVYSDGDDTKKYLCRWWDKKKEEFKTDTFEEHELKRVD